MLNLISRSKIRQRIILLFVNNRGKEYYINEIARIVNTTSGTAQRELNKLIKNSFITYQRKGNLVLLRLNEANPLLKELVSIVNKTIGIESVLKEEFSKLSGLDYAFIFGSYAKDDFRAESDVDVYIIGEIDDDKLHTIINKTEKLIQKEINTHVCSLNEFKRKLKESFFEKDVVKKYLLIFGDGNEFTEIIKRSRSSR